jgi:hypothetical protein
MTQPVPPVPIADNARDRHRVRRALLASGGWIGAGTLATHAPAPIADPFGTAELVEGSRFTAIPIGAARAAPDDIGFLDGIQRYWVDGWYGLTPVLRGQVAAAAMRRDGGELTVTCREQDKFLAVAARLTPAQRAAVRETGFPVLEYEAEARPHPLLDLRRAVRVVESRRDRLETRVAREFFQRAPGSWLAVDGAITGLGELSEHPRVLGLVKSHETQFLDGRDLEIALTLEPGFRTSVFARRSERGGTVYSWYVRLWPWSDQDLLYGLLRVERAARPETVAQATEVSRWLSSERAPLATPDGRWDRLLYPIHRVEEYLRAQAGAG